MYDIVKWNTNANSKRCSAPFEYLQFKGSDTRPGISKTYTSTDRCLIGTLVFSMFTSLQKLSLIIFLQCCTPSCHGNFQEYKQLQLSSAPLSGPETSLHKSLVCPGCCQPLLTIVVVSLPTMERVVRAQEKKDLQKYW